MAGSRPTPRSSPRASTHLATRELGARFDRVVALYPNNALALRGRVAWAHDWVSDPTLTPLFQALPGASFIVNGARLFLISLERGLGFNHCIERLFGLGRQIICIDVLPLQFFPCHGLAPHPVCHETPHLVCHEKPKTSPRTGRLRFWGKESSFFGVTWASRHAGHQGEVARFKRSKFFGHTRNSTLFLGRSSIFEQVVSDPSGNQW